VNTLSTLHLDEPVSYDGYHPSQEPIRVIRYDPQDHSGRERSENRTVGYQDRVLIDDQDAKS
jgi:hypothetical protein